MDVNFSQFKEINRAHEVLSDPSKRVIYDRYGEEGLQISGLFLFFFLLIQHQSESGSFVSTESLSVRWGKTFLLWIASVFVDWLFGVQLEWLIILLKHFLFFI